MEGDPIAAVDHAPVGAEGEDVAPDLLCACADDAHRRLRLPPDDRARAGLEDARLLACDRLDGVPKKVLVVEADGGDDAQGGREAVGIGRVEPAAHTNLKQRVIGRRPRESKHRRARGHLKEGDGLATIDRLNLVQQRSELGFGNRTAAHEDAFVEPHEVR